MRIALIQPDIKDFDILYNLNKLTNIVNCIKQDIDWIIFPEMFITGFITDRKLSEQSKTVGLDFMQEIAKEKHCLVEGSLLIEENNKQFNRHYLITPKDEIFYYDKKHLFSLSDERKLEAGKSHTIVNWNDWKINLLTCYDLRFPLWCRNEYKNNTFLYDIMVFVASWPESRSEQWLTLLKARAIENACYVIGVNRIGSDHKDIHYNGESHLINTKGEIITPKNKINDVLKYYNVEKSEIDSSRKKFPVYLDW